MTRMMKISTMAALIGGAAAFSIPASAQQGIEWTPERCAAEWTRFDGDGDGRLVGPEAEPMTRVETKVDTNDDGYISEDEYTVACNDGAFRDMKTQG